MEKKQRNQTLTVLFIGVLMGALDVAIVGPALPSIQKYFGVGDRAIAWVFSIYVLFNLVGTPLIAKFSDLIGRRTVYILDVAVFAAGSLLVAASTSFPMLLVGRSIQGLAAGGIFPVASAMIGDTFPAEQRGSALGLIGAVFGIAFLVGPILGGVLLIFGWQWLFLVNLPVAALVIYLSLRLLPRSAPQGKVAIDWLGMSALGGGLAALAFGVNRIDTAAFLPSLISINVLPYLVGSLVLLVAFVLRERVAPNPAVRLDLFRNRQMTLAYMLSAGAGLGESSLVFIPALAIAGLGVSASMSSFMLLPIVLVMAVGSPLAGRLLDKFGSRWVVMGGSALLALGMVILGLSSSQVALFFIAGVLIALGLSALLGAPIRYIMLNEAAPVDRSSAQGVVTLFGSIGQLMGGAVVGAVVASRGGGATGYESAYLAIGAVSALLVLATLWLKNRTSEKETVQRNESMGVSGAPKVQPE